MKIILGLICSPVFVVGFLVGLIMSPFWRGAVSGFYWIQAQDAQRINKIAVEEMAKREIQ